MTTTYEIYYNLDLIAENADRDYAIHAAGDALNDRARHNEWGASGDVECQIIGIDEHGAEVLVEDIEIEWTTEEGSY